MGQDGPGHIRFPCAVKGTWRVGVPGDRTPTFFLQAGGGCQAGRSSNPNCS
jgi:hypothetical protein